MKRHGLWLVAMFAMLGVLSLEGRRGQAQGQAPRFDLLDSNIVRVEAGAAAGGEAKETGTGIVVGVQPGRVRILTASHVVQGNTVVNVYFVNEKQTAVPAKVQPAASDKENLDLAVLDVTVTPGVKVPQHFLQLQFGPNAALAQGEHVWSVNGHWDPVPNTIVHLEHDGNSQKFEYTDTSIGEGYSGGPVFDDGGHLIGIHTSSGNKGSYKVSVATKMEAALETLVALDYDRASLNGVVPAKVVAQTPATGGGGAASSPAKPQAAPAPAADAAKQNWRDLNNNQMYRIQQDGDHLYIRQGNGAVVADLQFRTDKNGAKRFAGNSTLSNCPGSGYLEIVSMSESRIDGRIEQVPKVQNGKCGGVFGMMRQTIPIAFLREP